MYLCTYTHTFIFNFIYAYIYKLHVYTHIHIHLLEFTNSHRYLQIQSILIGFLPMPSIPYLYVFSTMRSLASKIIYISHILSSKVLLKYFQNCFTYTTTHIKSPSMKKNQNLLAVQPLSPSMTEGVCLHLTLPQHRVGALTRCEVENSQNFCLSKYLLIGHCWQEAFPVT